MMTRMSRSGPGEVTALRIVAIIAFPGFLLPLDSARAQDEACLCGEIDAIELSCATFPPDVPCIEQRMDLVRPLDCPDGVGEWCASVETTPSTLEGGSPASLLQDHCYVRLQPLPGMITVFVDGGTLDIARLAEIFDPGDPADPLDHLELGRFTISNDIGVRIRGPGDVCLAPRFVLVFAMVPTGVDMENETIFFDFVLRGEESINALTVTENVLDYDPRDANHSDGLLFEGELRSFGPGNGFQLHFRVPAHPPGASLAIEESELSAPGFGISALFEYLNPDRLGLATSPYTLPASGEVIVDTEIVQFQDRVSKLFTFSSSKENFIRYDANSDRDVDISDAIFTLKALFLGGAPPECLDAADANDDGRIDITDGVATLRVLFQGEPAMEGACGVDGTPDDLLVCEHPCQGA